MKVKIQIECNTISELSVGIRKLSQQIKRSARKQKLNPDVNEFSIEDGASLSEINAYGTFNVYINGEEPAK